MSVSTAPAGLLDAVSLEAVVAEMAAGAASAAAADDDDVKDELAGTNPAVGAGVLLDIARRAYSNSLRAGVQSAESTTSLHFLQTGRTERTKSRTLRPGDENSRTSTEVGNEDATSLVIDTEWGFTSLAAALGMGCVSSSWALAMRPFWGCGALPTACSAAETVRARFAEEPAELAVPGGALAGMQAAPSDAHTSRRRCTATSRWAGKPEGELLCTTVSKEGSDILTMTSIAILQLASVAAIAAC